MNTAILNGRVVKLAPDGTFLAQYGHLGDTAGALARPKDVAIDAQGNVYVSDSLLVAVQVFGSAGAYRGFIGLKIRRFDQAPVGGYFVAHP